MQRVEDLVELRIVDGEAESVRGSDEEGLAEVSDKRATGDLPRRVPIDTGGVAGGDSIWIDKRITGVAVWSDGDRPIPLDDAPVVEVGRAVLYGCGGGAMKSADSRAGVAARELQVDGVTVFAAVCGDVAEEM